MTSMGRCIAPDLIGMGKSDKPDIRESPAGSLVNKAHKAKNQ